MWGGSLPHTTVVSPARSGLAPLPLHPKPELLRQPRKLVSLLCAGGPGRPGEVSAAEPGQLHRWVPRKTTNATSTATTVRGACTAACTAHPTATCGDCTANCHCTAGSLLDNKELLDSLNETKAKSTTIAASLAHSKELQASLDAQREVRLQGHAQQHMGMSSQHGRGG